MMSEADDLPWEDSPEPSLPEVVQVQAAGFLFPVELVLEELRAIRKELAEFKEEVATRKQVAAPATAVAIIAAAKEQK